MIARCASRRTADSGQFLFGGIFGGDDKPGSDDLVFYPNLASSDLKFDSLVDYLTQWAKLFEGKGMGLTTPVSIRAASQNFLISDDVAKVNGVEIVFQKVATGYEDKDKEEDEDGKDNNKEEKEVKQGGVAVIVEQLKDDSGSIQVRARRCEIDDDTMIKEMSEETILKELKKAISVWKKEK